MPNTPTPPPRPLQHGAPAFSAGPFAGRHAARIRAIANSSQLPEERALADSMVMTAWLSAAQRETYAEQLRARPDAEDFVERLAEERRVVLVEGADPVSDELESAAQAEHDARQIPLRILEAALLLGAGACFAVAVLRTEFSTFAAGLSSRALPEGALALLIVLAVCLVAAAIVGTIATRRRDRLLLDWAVSRPGQLGRGLPVRRALQGGSAGPAVLRGLGPAVLVGAGILAICVGAAILLITLLSGEDPAATRLALWLLGGGVVSLLLAVIAVQLRSRRIVQIVRRARAAEWFGDQGQQGPQQGPGLLDDTVLGE